MWKALISLGVFIVLFIVFFSRYTIIRINERSMYPTLKHGEIYLLDRRFTIEPGKIYVVYVNGKNVVKRIVRTYQDLVWLEGDNQPQSSDSRHYGYVHKDYVLGRVIKREPRI